MLETLEDRYAPAVGIQMGTLEILGGPNTDNAIVWEANLGYEAAVWVNLNGAITAHLKAAMPNGIKFEGYGGDDRFDSSATVVVKAYGGPGNDYLKCGTGKAVLDGQNGNDTLLGNLGSDALRGGIGNDSMDGGAGLDFLNGNAGNDLMFGGKGADTLWGLDGNDTLVGGSGNDELIGDSGNDSLLGSNGKDYLYGSFDNDTLSGGNDSDTLLGNDGNDRLYGDSGNDTLSGGNGNDDLYGHGGNDTLDGGGGRDGLFAGYGWDEVTGGADADRFLTFDPDGDGQNVFAPDHDILLDANADDDAVIRFLTGDKDWTYSDVEAVDQGFAVLHHHALTQDTRLLRTADGDALTFYRRVVIGGDDIPEGYPPGDYAGQNTGNGNLYLADKCFGFDSAKIQEIVVHEIGHSWGSTMDNDFLDISGWTQDIPDGEQFSYVAAQGGWYYLVSAFDSFVSDYARTNPNEDFAETFAHLFMVGANDLDEGIEAKLTWMTVMVVFA